MVNRKQRQPVRKTLRKLQVNLRAVLGPAGPQKRKRIRQIEQIYISR